MCAFGEKKIPLDCLIYGQVYTENVSGGSIHSVTESTPHWDQTDLCSNPYSWEPWTLFTMGFSFLTYKMMGGEVTVLALLTEQSGFKQKN